MRGTKLISLAAAAVLLLSTVTMATAGFDLPPGDMLVRSNSSQPMVLGDSFTYQGRLTEGGGPASGVYDLRFILYDAESGGTQVGSTVAVNDVTVTGGLFTVSLDFGAGVWNGDARWMEIAVRPGASSGTYTMLSPRQAIGSTPYALYAKAAGGIAVPFSASGSVDSPDELFGITQTGTGIGLKVERGSTSATPYPAIYGLNSGAGGSAAVQGETLNTEGVGVAGFAAASGGGTAGLFIGNGADSTALEIGNGALKVSGAVVPAFVHTVTAASIAAAPDCVFSQCSRLSHPLLDGKPNAIVLVTYLQPGVSNPHAVGVDYVNGFWRIFNVDGAAIPADAKFNVLVISQ